VRWREAIDDWWRPALVSAQAVGRAEEEELEEEEEARERRRKEKRKGKGKK